MDLKHPLHAFVDDNVEIFTNEKDYKEYLEKAEAEAETNDNK
jgi:hypothetical protein